MSEETFEGWYRSEIEKATGELTYGRHSDTEHIKRLYINRKEYVSDAWNHQQKKIDELKKDNKELVEHGFMLVEQKRNATEKLQAAEEDLTKAIEIMEGLRCYMVDREIDFLEKIKRGEE